MTVATVTQPAPIAVVTPQRGRPRNLTETQARKLTDEIKHRSTALWMLVAEAHDRQAWKALGYKSWKEYAARELQMSESNSFKVLDTARVMREVAKAGVDVSQIDPPPARVIAVIKTQLPQVRKAARQSMRDGQPLSEALLAIAKTTVVPPSTAAPQGRAEDRVVVPSGHVSGKVECPGCNGNGLVTKPRAKQLAALLA